MIEKNKNNHALNGIKILDLTRVLGGPYATQILADHGAEVIKIESKIGDEVRAWGPPFINDMASYFINVNSCLLYTSPSPRDVEESRMPSSA